VIELSIWIRVWSGPIRNDLLANKDYELHKRCSYLLIWQIGGIDNYHDSDRGRYYSDGDDNLLPVQDEPMSLLIRAYLRVWNTQKPIRTRARYHYIPEFSGFQSPSYCLVFDFEKIWMLRARSRSSYRIWTVLSKRAETSRSGEMKFAWTRAVFIGDNSPDTDRRTKLREERNQSDIYTNDTATWSSGKSLRLTCQQCRWRSDRASAI
jgi:hypothetical protein